MFALNVGLLILNLALAVINTRSNSRMGYLNWFVSGVLVVAIVKELMG